MPCGQTAQPRTSTTSRLQGEPELDQHHPVVVDGAAPDGVGPGAEDRPAAAAWLSNSTKFAGVDVALEPPCVAMPPSHLPSRASRYRRRPGAAARPSSTGRHRVWYCAELEQRTAPHSGKAGVAGRGRAAPAARRRAAAGGEHVDAAAQRQEAPTPEQRQQSLARDRAIADHSTGHAQLVRPRRAAGKRRPAPPLSRLSRLW